MSREIVHFVWTENVRFSIASDLAAASKGLKVDQLIVMSSILSYHSYVKYLRKARKG